MTDELALTLPWPPTVNHYWGQHGKRRYVAKAGMEFRAAVRLVVLQTCGGVLLTGRLSVVIVACPPDRRARDLDNLFKASLDALQHAGVYESDSQIDSLTISRGDVCVGGALIVRIWEQ